MDLVSNYRYRWLSLIFINIAKQRMSNYVLKIVRIPITCKLFCELFHVDIGIDIEKKSTQKLFSASKKSVCVYGLK